MKKNLTKLVSFLLAGVVVSGALAGCGGNKNAGLTDDSRVLLKITTSQKDVDEEGYNKAMARYAEF